MNEHRFHNTDKIIQILIFGLAVYIPLVVGIIQVDKIVSSSENRNLATFPSTPKSIKEFSKYTEALSLYYSDHFGLREVFSEIYFKYAYKFAIQPSTDDVTFGQDGWMFLGGIKPGYQKYNDPMGDAMNKNLYSEKQLEDFARAITIIKNWLSDRGIEYIYVIAPSKHTIYSEKLPKYISKKNKQSAADQLIKYLHEHTDVIVVDLRPILLDEKKNHQVYFKSDTHWNHYGANVAQFEIMNNIKPLFPEQVSPSLLNDDQFKVSTRGGGDLARLARIENIINEDDPKPVFDKTCSPVKEMPNTKGREIFTMVCENKELNAVIFRDSFFTLLEPYISRYFHRSTYISTKISYNSLVKYGEQERPDIVIEEVVERSLPYVPKSTPLFVKDTIAKGRKIQPSLYTN